MRHNSQNKYLKPFDAMGFEIEVRHNRYNNKDIDNALKILNAFPMLNCYASNKNIDNFLNILDVRFQRPDCLVSPRGGQTLVTITKDGFRGEGVANCSILDNFERNKGIQLAIGRAYENWKCNVRNNIQIS